MADESNWRNDLTDDQRRMLTQSESEVNEGGIDCYQWKWFVSQLAVLLDEAQEGLNELERIRSDDHLGEDQ